MNIILFNTSNKNTAISIIKNEEIFQLNNLNNIDQNVLAYNTKLLLSIAKIEIRDLNMIVLPKGPGSFMGLKIFYSFAKGLALKDNIPLIALDQFKAYSQYFFFFKEIKIILIQADSKSYYTTVFKNDKIIEPCCDLKINEIFKLIEKYQKKNILIIGSNEEFDNIENVYIHKYNVDLTQVFHELALKCEVKDYLSLDSEPFYMRGFI